jgi:hypothetical protein
MTAITDWAIYSYLVKQKERRKSSKAQMHTEIHSKTNLKIRGYGDGV